MKGAIETAAVRTARCMASIWAIGLVLCLPTASALGQHPAAQRPEMRPRFSGMRAPRNQNQPKMNQARPAFRNPGQQFPQYRGSGAPTASVRPAMPGQGYSGLNRPVYPNAGSTYAPPGHLGAWLDAHRNLPPQDQQRMLHNDPSFNRLPPQQQQRLVQQLNRVDQMPEAQRERRLARAENLERLSPQERSQVQESARRWTTLAPDRQAVMKNAFRDLRSVPPDQRETVLNSARYQNAFSPDERGILSNMLRVEPFEAPR